MTTIKPLLGNSVLCIVCHPETFVKKTDFVTLFWILIIKNIAITYFAAAWPNGYGVRLRIGRLWVRVPSWSKIFKFLSR